MPISHAGRYLEVEIRTATPTGLVVLMYDAALSNLQKAQEHLAAHEIEGRVHCINKALGILTELEASLNFEAGKDISVSLQRLYQYLKEQLFRANTRQESEPLKEAVRLLGNLRAAWSEVARKESKESASLSVEKGSLPSLPLGANLPGSTLANLNITA
jgi:flagellar protein FliS